MRAGGQHRVELRVGPADLPHRSIVSGELGHREALPVGFDLEYFDQMVAGTGGQTGPVEVHLGIVLKFKGNFGLKSKNPKFLSITTKTKCVAIATKY